MVHTRGKASVILTISLNPCVDTVLFVHGLKIGDTNTVNKIERDAGGKGINLSRIVNKLGGSTLASGLIGGGTGAHILSVLDAEKVPHDFVRIHGESRTNIFIESGNGAPTCLDDPGPVIDDSELHALLDEVQILCKDAAWIAIGGAIPPGVRDDVFCVLTEIAHATAARVVLDADGAALINGIKAGPDLIKPNVREAERLLGRAILGIDATVSAASEIRQLLLHDQQRRTYRPIVIISMGAEGAVMSCHEGVYVGKAPQVRTVSSIGSGDSMVGAFVYEMQQGQSPAECLRWGLAAGAATAMSSGAEIASRHLVLRLLPGAKVVCHVAA